MFNQLKNSFFLFLLYCVIIIGIFTLQFKNESVVTETFGNLKASFAQSRSEDGEIFLRNQFLVKFPGIEFQADDAHPAKILLADGSEQILTISSYEKGEGNLLKILFDDSTNIEFSDDDGMFSIHSNLPEDAKSITLNFKPSSDFSITQKTPSRQLFTAKESKYFLTANSIDDKTITLSAKNPSAIFAPYEPEKAFSFSDVASDLPTIQNYENAVSLYREKIVSEFEESAKTPSKLTEEIVAAYIAEMTSRGKYADALKLVPDSFVKNGRFTYFTAPFFGNMKNMFPSLQMKIANVNSMIKNALTAEKGEELAAFTQMDLAEFLNVFGETKSVKEFLSIPASKAEEENFAPTLEQAAGILRAYSRLLELHAENLAAILEPSLMMCIAAITEKCVYSESDGTISLRENSMEVSEKSAAEVGAALIEFGESFGNENIAIAGKAILSGVLSNKYEISQFVKIYPLIVQNKAYPRAQILSKQKNIWVWTGGSEQISYTEQNGVGKITLSAKTGDISHSIIVGIPPFKSIRIYGLAYRSDPQFEKYATSGYVYSAKEKALFLKTRHKSDTEVVNLTFK